MNHIYRSVFNNALGTKTGTVFLSVLLILLSTGQPALAAAKLAVLDAETPWPALLMAAAERDVTVHLSKPGVADPVFEALAGADQPVQALHLVSHGAPGRLSISGKVLDSQSLSAMGRRWRPYLAPGATIVLYGCEAGKGIAGRKLVEDLSLATGARVLASSTPTGAAALGGDWRFDISSDANSETVPPAHTVSAFSAAHDTWPGLLVTVSNTNDDGAGSFREAAESGATSFEFDGLSGTLGLTTGTVTIGSGPSALAFLRLIGGGTNLTIGGDDIALNIGDNRLYIDGSGSPLDLTINSNITGSGALVIGDPDSDLTVTLGGNNSMVKTTGGIGNTPAPVSIRVENNDTLAIGAANALGSGTLGLSSGTLQVTGTTTINNGIHLDIGGGTIDTDLDVTIAGDIDGYDSLTKTGVGSLTLSGTNTYTGGTTVSAGTLAGTTTSLQGDILNNASVVFDQAIDGTYAGVMSGTGSLTKNSTGTVTLSGANTYSGTTTVSAGTFSISADNNLGAGTLILDGGTLQTTGSFSTNRATTLSAGGGTFNTDAGTTLTQSGQISGGGTLTKTGTGTLVLNATNNNYAGGTVVSQGTLRLIRFAINDAGNISNDATVEFNQASAGGTYYYDVMSGGGNLVKTGGGIVILRNTNNYSGGTTISNGTLALEGTAGSITGDVTNNGTLHFIRSNAYTFSGAISGNGAVIQQGSDILTLSGANTYSGGTTVSGGTLVGTTTSLQGDILNNATVSFDQSTDGTYAGVMSGSGAFTKAGSGTVILSGANTYSGPTTIDGGILSVNGSLASDVTVNSGGTLGGNGAVGSVTLSGGAVGPGNSIGTLNVAGDIDFSGGGVYEVEVDAAGNSDRIIAGGTATLTGGSVQVLPEAGSYNFSTDYTILTAGSISGSFDAVSSSLAFLDPSLSYDSNNVYLNLVRNDVTFAGVANTPNQQAVGDALGVIAGSNPSGDMATILSEVTVLTASGAQQAYDSLSGAQHATTQSLLMSTGRHFAGVLSARTRHLAAASGKTAELAAWRPAQLAYNGGHGGLQLAIDGLNTESERPQGSGFWISPEAGKGSIDDTRNAAGLDYSWYGLYGGADTWLDPQRLLGIAVGARRSDADLAAGDADIDWLGVALYGRWQDQNNYLDASIDGGIHRVDTRRQIVVGALQRTATADYDARSLTLAVESGRRLFERNGWQLTPFAGLRYAHVRRDGFTESGADAANLVVEEETQNSLSSRLGVHAQRDAAVDQGLSWDATLAWAHEFSDSASTLNSSLTGAPGTLFRIDGPELDRNRLEVSAGLSSTLGKGANLRVAYDGELSGSDSRHALSANLMLTW